jgi:CMP-N-acetylneuraminic acid synthetase
MFSIVALLPMKANSERVKGKNFKNFCGKPLFQWVLDSLLAVERIDKIIINTDARSNLKDFHILNNDKVIIRDRPDDICGDFVSMNKIISNDIENINAETFLMTHTTNPLLLSSTIENAIDKYLLGLKGGYDSLFTVNQVQTRFYDTNINPLNHDPQNLIRTQDLPVWYEENSNLYLFSKDSFSKNNARVGENPQIVVSNSIESTDIDTPDDWDLAEVLVEYYKKKGIIL